VYAASSPGRPKRPSREAESEAWGPPRSALASSAPRTAPGQPNGMLTPPSRLPPARPQAVLLLKPNIILFSTDAAPLNAGPAWPTEGVAQNDDVDPADFDPSGLPAPPVEPAVERTCDCLTSSLACHGCGATVGYHIVQPCARCTASVARHQRSANHQCVSLLWSQLFGPCHYADSSPVPSHSRYVFHHNEVTSTERRYFPGEPGIVPLHPLTHNTAAILQRTRSPTPPVEPAEKGEAPSSASRRRERHTQSPFPQRRAGDVLRAGDTVYWHNLAPGGERSRPVDPHTRPARIAQRAAR